MSLSQAERDQRYALELRKRIVRGGGHWELGLSTLRHCFGGQPLTLARKAEVERALEDAGVEAYPSLRDTEKHGKVHLSVVRSPGREHPLILRVRWRLSRVWILGVGLLAVLGSIASLVTWVFPSSSDTPAPVSPTPMSGDLNIAVLPFTANGGITPEGATLAQAVSTSLRSHVSAIQPGLQVEIRDLGDVAVGDRKPPAVRLLATRNNADIVLYGSLTQDATGATLRTRFYLNRAKLPSASELGGDYSYAANIAAPFPLSISPQTRAQVRDRLVHEADNITTFFVAVGDYLTHSYGRARANFKAALRGAVSQDVRSLSLLFLGNVSAQENEPLRARGFYLAALRDRTTRSRAEYGLAETAYTIARGHCSKRSVDQAGLDRARQAFAAVSVSPNQFLTAASAAVLEAKVEFGRGQVDVCLSEAGVTNAWARARIEMHAVIRSYASSQPELRDDAAEAWAAIGLADLRSSPSDPHAAKQAYAMAAQLTSLPSRRSFFDRMSTYAVALE